MRETRLLRRNNFDKLFTITPGIVKENLSEMPFLQTKLIQVLKNGNADQRRQNEGLVLTHMLLIEMQIGYNF